MDKSPSMSEAVEVLLSRLGHAATGCSIHSLFYKRRKLRLHVLTAGALNGYALVMIEIKIQLQVGKKLCIQSLPEATFLVSIAGVRLPWIRYLTNKSTVIKSIEENCRGALY